MRFFDLLGFLFLCLVFIGFGCRRGDNPPAPTTPGGLTLWQEESGSSIENSGVLLRIVAEAHGEDIRFLLPVITIRASGGAMWETDEDVRKDISSVRLMIREVYPEHSVRIEGGTVYLDTSDEIVVRVGQRTEFSVMVVMSPSTDAIVLLPALEAGKDNLTGVTSEQKGSSGPIVGKAKRIRY